MKKFLFLFLFLFSIYSIAQEKSDSVKFVASKKSEVYHYPSCSHAQRISPTNLLTFKTLQEAVDSDRRPCKVCNPPGVKTSKVKQNKKSTPTKSYSGRCQATTKKGSQCKRKAKAGSNYCWQHGG